MATGKWLAGATADCEDPASHFDVKARLRFPLQAAIVVTIEST